MNWAVVVILVLICGLSAWFMTALVRRYALAASIVDVPNARSSHTTPTPRGGGVSIVLVGLALIAALSVDGTLERAVAAGLAGGGALVALIGFLDDHGHVDARWRLLAHFVAAGWLLYWLGGVPAVSLAGTSVAGGVTGTVLGLLYVVWLLNLYNFMDGIDGIASVQGITVLVGAVIVAAVAKADGSPDLLCLGLAAAVAGFLVWNFPPARIFMGDAGSGFLGYMLAALSLAAAVSDVRLFWPWLILLAVFVADATVTLVRRLLQGAKVYEAHRSHAYQRAARRFGAHLPVTALVSAINVFVLLPLALAVAAGRVSPETGLLLSYGPLFVLAWVSGAGLPDRRVA